MKLNKEEVKYLNEFLNKELIYRETYNEMQDHIMTALELYADNVSFESAFNEIIQMQFGGKAGLRAIDRQCRKHGLAEMRKRYVAHMIDMFKFPSMLYICLVAIGVFLIFNYTTLNMLGYMGIFSIVSAFPGILNFIRYFKAGYYYGSTKRSVSDDGFRFLKHFPGIIFALLVVMLWCVNFKPTDIIEALNPTIVTMIFMLYFLHAVAFYKMYRQEFKVNTAQ